MENRSTRLAVKLDRLDFEVDRVDDFSIDSTWPRFDRLDRSTRSTTGRTLFFFSHNHFFGNRISVLYIVSDSNHGFSVDETREFCFDR